MIPPQLESWISVPLKSTVITAPGGIVPLRLCLRFKQSANAQPFKSTGVGETLIKVTDSLPGSAPLGFTKAATILTSVGTKGVVGSNGTGLSGVIFSGSPVTSLV